MSFMRMGEYEDLMDFAKRDARMRDNQWNSVLTLATMYSHQLSMVPRRVPESDIVRDLEEYFAGPSESPFPRTVLFLGVDGVLQKRPDLLDKVLRKLEGEEDGRSRFDMLVALASWSMGKRELRDEDEEEETGEERGKRAAKIRQRKEEVFGAVLAALERVVEDRMERKERKKGAFGFMSFASSMMIKDEDLGKDLEWGSGFSHNPIDGSMLIPVFVGTVVSACLVLSYTATRKSVADNAPRLVALLGALLAVDSSDKTKGKDVRGKSKDWSYMVRGAAIEAILGCIEAEDRVWGREFYENGMFIAEFGNYPKALDNIVRLLTRETYEEVWTALRVMPYWYAHNYAHMDASSVDFLGTILQYSGSGTSGLNREVGLLAVLRCLQAGADEDGRVDFEIANPIVTYPGAIPYFVPSEFHTPWMPTLVKLFTMALRSYRDAAKAIRNEHPCVHKTLVTIIKRTDSESLRKSASNLLKLIDPTFRKTGKPNPELSKSRPASGIVVSGSGNFFIPGLIPGDIDDGEEPETGWEEGEEVLPGLRALRPKAPQRRTRDEDAMRAALANIFGGGSAGRASGGGGSARRPAPKPAPKKKKSPSATALEQGRTLFLDGKLEESREKFFAALKSDSQDIVARAASNLSMVCLKLGQHNDAIRYALWPSVAEYEPMKEKLKLRLALAYEATAKEPLKKKALAIAKTLKSTKAVQELLERLEHEIPEDDSDTE